MKSKTLLALLLAVASTAAIAQSSAPQLKALNFQQVAENYNTYNDHREALTFVSGFTLDGDANLIEKNPVEVLFNPVSGTDRQDCKLLRWDPVSRAWVKFPGNQLRSVKEQTTAFWSAGVNAPGVYALMKENNWKGTTRLVVPNGYRAESWKYVQSSAGIVCEGYTPGQELVIPLPGISPLATVSMQLRKSGVPLMNVSGVPVGKLVEDLWKDAAVTDATFELTLASL
jgi:hypothetical protein